MATQVAFATNARQRRYAPRGKNQLHAIFEKHFSDFCDQYQDRFGQKYGRYHLPRIEGVGERFGKCGDYRYGVARIGCTNPECAHDHFRPFSCKGSTSARHVVRAGRPIRTGVIIAHQTFGDMLRWNPHFHSIVLEGGFDEQGTFLYIHG